MTNLNAELQASLTKLTLQWSSAFFQRSVSQAVGLDFDDSTIRAIYVVGARGGVLVGEIADTLHVSRPTATKIVTRAETIGLVKRVRSQADGRARMVQLTNFGTRIFEQLVTAGVDMVTAVTENWSQTDQRQLAKLLERFVNDLVADEIVTQIGVSKTP